MTNEEFQRKVISLLSDIKSNTDNYDRLTKLLEYLKEIKEDVDSIRTDVGVIRKDLNDLNV